MSAAVASSSAASGTKGSFVSESQRRIDALSAAVSRMQSTTADASRCCEQISKRANHLDSLTSPASDASSALTRAGANLTLALALMKDAREKFDTISDCEPAMERLALGVKNEDSSKQKDKRSRKSDKNNKLTEQDIYAAADSMEIIRDAYSFFVQNEEWRSTPAALAGLERIHKMGTQSMCRLVQSHLKVAGPAVKPKRIVKKKGKQLTPQNKETADETRERLNAALLNRDLLHSIGEYEETQPVEARAVRELRSIFECLSGDGWYLGPSRVTQTAKLLDSLTPPASKVVRTEKVGSGNYTDLLKSKLKTGYPHLDTYGETRKNAAFTSLDSYYRRNKSERKKKLNASDIDGNADAAARDAVRCLEHAMVVVAGEKAVYRTVVGPSMTAADDDDEEDEMAPLYKRACVAAYSHVAATAVDRTLDILETVFLKEGGIGHNSGAKDEGTVGLSVRSAAAGAAAGLRMLDGVRMLGPSLAKLCEVQPSGSKASSQSQSQPQSQENMSIAATLCINIHRTTVKNSARTLENLSKAIQEDPLDGEKHRPRDAGVAPVSSDVVHAIRILCPFNSAYKSVTKRRALPWDPNIGEEAGEIDAFVRFLIMRVLNSLQGKALSYTRDVSDDAQAKSNIFMLNNLHYLRKELGPKEKSPKKKNGDGDEYRIESSWYTDKLDKMNEAEKRKYLGHWEEINRHLTSVDDNNLQFQRENVLSLESGRLIKSRFTGFNDDFEKAYELHKRFTVFDKRLKETLIKEVKASFLSRYKRFYDKFSRIQFSKKNMEQYLKYPPNKVDSMLNNLFSGSAE